MVHAAFRLLAGAEPRVGGIDLDPAFEREGTGALYGSKVSSPPRIDGLSQPWAGRVFLNPPYESKLVGPFVEKLLSEPVEQAQSSWSTTQRKPSGAKRYLSVRTLSVSLRADIQFLDSGGSPKLSPLQGQMILGIGIEVESFRRELQSTPGLCYAQTEMGLLVITGAGKTRIKSSSASLTNAFRA